jgi:dephospho-CoA kinase
MLIVAMTGGIGAGKSTAIEMFKKHDVPVIDTDVIARELVDHDREILDAIIADFGNAILDEHQQLDRARLREIVFNDEKKRERLQSILHPRIHQQVMQTIKSMNAAYCLVVIPLLVESKQDYPHHRVLLIDAKENCQIERAAARDNNSKELIKKIMAVQASREERKNMADDIIDNSGSLRELQQQVDALHDTYLEMAGSESFLV